MQGQCRRDKRRDRAVPHRTGDSFLYQHPERRCQCQGDDREGARKFAPVESLDPLEAGANGGERLRGLIDLLAALVKRDALAEATARYNPAGPQ